VSLGLDFAANSIEFAIEEAAEWNSILSRKAIKKWGLYGVVVEGGFQFGWPPVHFSSYAEQGQWAK
jgi:hypothetical protein